MVTVPGYQIERLLNWGSQGDVFLAVDGEGRQVALKIVAGERLDENPDAAERLRREARLLRAVDSPHVVQVHDIVESAPYCALVLEFLVGLQLDQAVRDRSGLAAAVHDQLGTTLQIAPGDRLPADAPEKPPEIAAPVPLQTTRHVAWVLDIALQLTRGVADLHAIQLIHRDLKPQNVMLVDGRVVLIDFGFARMDGLTTMTQSGAAIGTLAFMSPEQFAGRRATLRSDVYGLGAVIYYCCTGAPPIGTPLRSLADLARRRRPPQLRRCNPAVDPALARIVARSLEPDPRDRYASASELYADLQCCQRGQPVRIPFSPSRLWRHHRHLLPWVGMVVALFLVLGAGWVWRGVAEFAAPATATALLVEVTNAPDAARSRWSQLRQEQQLAVLAVWNARASLDAARATDLATTLQLGLLRLDAREQHRGALLPARDGEAPENLPATEFQSLEVPRCLLVRPGRCWFLLYAENPTTWWSAADPLCLQFLLDVAVPDGPVAPRALGDLPTAGANLLVGEAIHFAAGSVPFHTAVGGTSAIAIGEVFAVAATEVDRYRLYTWRRLMAGRRRERDHLDPWLRHPDEPSAVADRLWAMWSTREGEPTAQERSLPATTSFWEAHRLATWSGWRLPSLREWYVVSRDAGQPLGTVQERQVPGEPGPTTGDPGWDRTRHDVRFANSNVREWSLHRSMVREIVHFAAVPGVARDGNGPTFFFNPAPIPIDASPPEQSFGLRPYRTVVRR